MKKILIMAVAMVVAFGAFAQEVAQNAENPQKGRSFQRPMMQGQGPWLVRMFTKKENFSKLGIADKAKADKLLADLEAIKTEGNALEKKIREISREQAELMRKLFADKTSDSKEVMNKIDEVAKLRADQARLSVKTIMMLRENLSDEQMENARGMMMERGKMRRSSRQNVKGQEEGRRPRGKGKRGAARKAEPAE